jgi:hypothetical protein
MYAIGEAPDACSLRYALRVDKASVKRVLRDT